MRSTILTSQLPVVRRSDLRRPPGPAGSQRSFD